jgi:uncharacterized protein
MINNPNLSYFAVDRILKAAEICNFKHEQDTLVKHAMDGHCVRLIGPRNFGKTSIVKSVVGHAWIHTKSQVPHLFIYADLYAVRSELDFSVCMTKAFNDAMSSHVSTLGRGLNILKGLRPNWSPSSDGSDLGSFSVTIDGNGGKIIPYELLFENIAALHAGGKFKILMALDEFQEIAHVKGLEGKLRNCLQMLDATLPVIALGSKHHLLTKIFESPRKPFYKWGFSVELRPINYEDYYQYMLVRFKSQSMNISLDDSKYLQDRMKRVPESINRLCEHLLNNRAKASITKEAIDAGIRNITDESQSIYSHVFANFSAKERDVLTAVAKLGTVVEPTGRQTLALLPQISKSQVPLLFNKIIDSGILTISYRKDGKAEYFFEDAFLEEYIKRFYVF